MSLLEQLAAAAEGEEEDESDEDYVPPQAELQKLEAELAEQEASANKHTSLDQTETEDSMAKKEKLWDSFLKDVGPRKKIVKPAKPSINEDLFTIKPKPKTEESGSSSPKPTRESDSKLSGVVEIRKVFDFAGESVVVTKKVAADSKEAKKASEEQESCASPQGLKRPPPSSSGSSLSAIVGQLGKKPKMGTLQKSSIDWRQFKQNEGLTEELEAHRKSKDSYLDKKDFLTKVDWAQFEQEKSMRDKIRASQSKT